MAYKTLMLKIYNPTKSKCALMDSAILRYGAALQFILDGCRSALLALAAEEKPVSRTLLLKLPDKGLLKQLNRFDVEPFKDSLKIEFAAISANFIVQHRRNPAASFPAIIQPETDGQSDIAEAHPVYFGRYAINRDFCLMYDRSTGRYYAKLYLLNKKSSIIGEKSQGRLQLKYIVKGMPDVTRFSAPRRFIVVPLAFGRHQLNDLNRLLECPGLVKTARLKKLNGNYYLLVSMECALPQKAAVTTVMGIVRGFSGGLHYTVCDSGGNTIESALIEKPMSESQKLYLLAKQIIEVCRRHHPQVVVEGNGGKNDKLLFAGQDINCRSGIISPADSTESVHSALTTTEYARLVKILFYKLPGEGLPPPIVLSANRLFNTCPACNATSQKSRISRGLFICVECGCAFPAELSGSLCLVHKLQRYQRAFNSK